MRSGLSQDKRRREELGRRYILPDDRDIADLILFGQRFSELVKYYDAGNKLDATWAEFFQSDESAGLAALAKLPVDAVRSFHHDLEAWLRADPDRGAAKIRAHARLLFHLPLALVRLAGELFARIPRDHPMRNIGRKLYENDLDEHLENHLRWYKGAEDVALLDDHKLREVDYNLGGQNADLGISIPDSVRAVLRFGNRPIDLTPGDLRSAATSWSAFYDTIPEDTRPYDDAETGGRLRYNQMYDALSYNLVSTTIQRIYQGLERLRREATTALEISLKSFADHAPHYALWLAFLELFGHAQGMLNEFTGRHLDFYFGEVLKLSRRAATPDKVHLLFELTKETNAFLLPAGTALNAGKDTKGRPLQYRLDNDLVINRATIAELRGVRVEGGGAVNRPAQVPRAAVVVRSRDGLGKVDLPRDDQSWAPFGPAASPLARVGFAIADRQLFLREGTRRITITVDLDATLDTPGVSPRWNVRLSGPKGWFEISDPSRVITTMRNAALEIRVDLVPDDPAVVPLDAKVHGKEHQAGLPVMEVLFDVSNADGTRAFAALRDATVRGVTITVTAGGLKDLMVVAGGATVDPARQFAAFGVRPAAGSDLVIGSSEIFSKPILRWGIDIEWKDTPPTFFSRFLSTTLKASEAVLAGGAWQRAPNEIQLQIGGTDHIEFSGSNLIDGRATQSLKNPSFDARAVNGFARVRLISLATSLNRLEAEADLGRVRIMESYALGPGTSSGAESVEPTPAPTEGLAIARPMLRFIAPDEPESEPPEVSQLRASYETVPSTPERVRTLHPFGIAPVDETRRLFPELPYEGALFIGVRDLRPPERLTILVQVLDGSGDPLRDAPALRHAYLSGNRWIDFDQQDVDDKTFNFTTSGILGLDVPEQADTIHSIMPSHLRWIRVSAMRDADALNRLSGIDAQAGRATFAGDGDHPSGFTEPLAAGKVTKLVVPIPAIKKVKQPWHSFGGRPAEDDERFARRVSERLRHKDRAITPADYEMLVLEAFPELFRVKCLMTTKLMRNRDNAIVADNEVMPGAVTVVTVPHTHVQHARNPLRPYADQATLKGVHRFLRRRVSPFVDLEVQNPKFEEVHARFKVRFRPEIGDVAFYTLALNDALVRFLTPWSRADGAEISFGGRLFKSAIINFVEEQPAVDFVSDVQVFHKVDADAPDESWRRIDVDMIEATTARSILVSAPRHQIEEYTDDA